MPGAGAVHHIKLDRVGQADAFIHVRTTPNTGHKFNASVPVALRQSRPNAPQLDRGYQNFNRRGQQFLVDVRPGAAVALNSPEEFASSSPKISTNGRR
jgi:hypothetical protein